MRTVGMISLGCVKNRVDSEQMLKMLKDAGYEIVAAPEKAEVLIVNTCGFIDPAKEESLNAVFEMAEYKKTGACKALIVTGCLVQRYAEAIKEEIPEIDCLLGVSQYDTLIDSIERTLGGERPVRVERKDGFLECGRVLTTPPYSAYVRIAEGCDNRCAYCAIPLIRGAYRSRPRRSIIDEMKVLAQNGAREQILIAQDTTRYGIDTGDTLASLIDEAAQIPGIDWLRVLYTYPDELSMDVLDVMEKHQNVCKYLDLPLQHASPRLLALMNRRGTVESSRSLLLSARARGFALRTTFIVGFPGETEEDFDMLMDFTREIAFDRMGAFAFSPEEGTPAADMPDQVPEDVKKARLDRLMTLQAGISLARNQSRLQTVCRVLVTGKRGRAYIGRSAWEAPDADGEIAFTSQSPLTPGQFVDVRITSATEYDLAGEATEGTGERRGTTFS